jgi:Ca-activated chloride channel family protein
VRLVSGLTDVRRSHAGAFLAVLRWLALAAFIVALAQPRLSHSETHVTASGIDIVVALDLSGSMRSEDFMVNDKRVNRFNMARAVLKDFIEKRPNDRIGLVVFAADAFIATPVTLDHDFLEANLDRMDVGTIDGSRTAVGSGITVAVNRLRELQSKSKIVILMTDGEDNASKVPPLTAAEAAQALNVKIYTIGVGKQGTAPMPVGRDRFSGELIYRDEPVDIDEDTLTKIADKTGGKYYRADNAEKFEQIYAEIDKLEKTEATINKYTQHRELFGWVIVGGLSVLLAEVLLAQTTLRRLP